MKKIKFIKQTDPKDCGPVCMAMIANYYGLDISVTRLREYGGTDLRGTNIKGLMFIGEKLGFDVTGVRAESPDALSEVTYPAIAHIITEQGMAHFVIIESYKDKIVSVVDPAKGRIDYHIDDFSKLWTGILVLINKNQYFKPGKQGVKFLPMLMSIVKPNKNLLFSVFVASLFLNILGFASSFYFKFLVDDIVPNKLLTSLHTVSIGILLLYIVQQVLSFCRSHLILYFSMRTDITLMLGYYRHVLGLPMNFFETRKVGEILSRFMDASKIRQAVATTAVTSMIDIVMIIVGTVLLYIQNSTLFFMTLLVVPLYFVLAYAFRKPYDKYNEEQMEANARLNSYLVESVSGIGVVKSYGAEQEIFVKAETYFVKLLKKIFKLGFFTNSQNAIKGFLDLSISLFILWIGSTNVIAGTMTLGELLTFNALVIYFLGPIERFIELQPTIQSAMVAAKRLGEIFELEDELTIQKDYARKIDTLFTDKIKFQDVDFGYGARESIIENINFEVAKGSQVAFVGASGSGKTTIAKLLVGFYGRRAGEITFDETSIDGIDLESIRENIAYVSQQAFFFSGTILENLLYGIPNVIDFNMVETACRRAEAHDFISKMPQGYDSMLEENGSNLSGGQLQRLSLAKAFLKNPEIIILDEATSALDSITEQKIIESLRYLKEHNGTTLIMIAHRLSTIQESDNIYVLKDKEIVESGKHKELIDNNNEYYRLWKNQSI